MLKYLIKTITVDSSGANSINFTNIPQTYDDLVLEVSARSSQTGTNEISPIFLKFNNSSAGAGYTNKVVAYMDSTIARSATNQYNITTASMIAQIATNGSTSNTFGNSITHIPNYTKGTYKQFGSEIASLQDSTTDYSFYNGFAGALWSDTSAINSINLFVGTSAQYSFTQYTTASLYGVKRGSDGATGPTAIGGTVTTSGGYTYHTFTGSGSFQVNKTVAVDVLTVAGGAGGGATRGGGGGAGGYLASSLQLSPQQYPIVVGAGGAGGSALSSDGFNGFSGTNSTFGTLLTAIGGGFGPGNNSAVEPGTGGSGGGAILWGGPGGAGTAGQGNAGGNSPGYLVTGFGAGGGGAGAVGGNSTSTTIGSGGAGLQWLNGTYYAGGGGGGYDGTGTGTGGSGGTGGGGNGGTSVNTAGTAGTANTGGGGGAGSRNSGTGSGYAGAAGGSGVVIIRYLTPA
jgi:hypothetical protein